MELKFNYNLS